MKGKFLLVCSIFLLWGCSEESDPLPQEQRAKSYCSQLYECNELQQLDQLESSLQITESTCVEVMTVRYYESAKNCTNYQKASEESCASCLGKLTCSDFNDGQGCPSCEEICTDIRPEAGLEGGYCLNQDPRCAEDLYCDRYNICSLFSCNDCAPWEDCDTTEQTCTLKTNKCNSNGDCLDETLNTCGGADNHSCINADDFLCSSCADWQSCNFSGTGCQTRSDACLYDGDCKRNPNGVTNCDEATHKCVFDCSYCKSWQTCNEEDQSCTIKEGLCSADIDCAQNENDMTKCDINDSHKCVFNCGTCGSDSYCNDEQSGCVLINIPCEDDTACKDDADGRIFCDLNQKVCIKPLFDCSQCEAWENCNDSQGTCPLKTGMCRVDDDCKDDFYGKTKCSSSHLCIKP